MARKKSRGTGPTRTTRKRASGAKGPARPRKTRPRGKAPRPAGRPAPIPAPARGLAATAQQKAEPAWLARPSRARVEREILALRKQVARDRAQRYAAYLRQVVNPTEPPVALAMETGIQTLRALAPAAGKMPLRILAEGDSWFSYPLPPVIGDGVIHQLQTLLGYSIANMASPGEEVRQMLGLAQRQEIITRLKDGRIRYDAMLFSGGGNDLAGDQFITWLKDNGPVPPPDQMLDDDAVSAGISLLEAEFNELIAIRDRYSPGTIIFVNCYDFPKVTGIGVCTFGPWLKPSLDYAYQQMGVSGPTQAQEDPAVKELLLRFSQMLQKVATTASKFVVVDTQGTLDPDKDWRNELHPTTAGFVKIAKKFQAALSAAFP